MADEDIMVGDSGTLVSIDITEPDASGNQVATTFDLLDDVNFVFRFSDGSKKTFAGAFTSGSNAEYELVVNDIQVPGRCEIQLQIDTTPSSGTATPWIGSSSRLVINIGEKL